MGKSNRFGFAQRDAILPDLGHCNLVAVLQREIRSLYGIDRNKLGVHRISIDTNPAVRGKTVPQYVKRIPQQITLTQRDGNNAHLHIGGFVSAGASVNGLFAIQHIIFQHFQIFLIAGTFLKRLMVTVEESIANAQFF